MDRDRPKGGLVLGGEDETGGAGNELVGKAQHAPTVGAGGSQRAMKRAAEYGARRSRSVSPAGTWWRIFLFAQGRTPGAREHALGAVLQIDLKRHVLGRIVGVGLRANSDQAIAQPPLQRAQRLPFQAIDRIACGMRLRNGHAGELLAGIVVVADGAAEVELALAAPIDLGALLAKRTKPRVVGRRDRLAARLERDIGPSASNSRLSAAKGSACWLVVRQRLMRPSRSTGLSAPFGMAG